MCQWFKSLFGLCDEETVKKQLEELRKDLISENEERLLDEKWKRSEQRDQIDMLKSRLLDLEKNQNNAPHIVQRQPVPPQPIVNQGQYTLQRPGQIIDLTTWHQGVPPTRIPVVRQQTSVERDQIRVRNAATRVAQNVKTTTKTTEDQKEK